MTASTQHAIRLSPRRAAGPPSRARKQFNALVQKLEAERAELAHWRSHLPGIRAIADGTLVPLLQAFDACQRNLLLLYDKSWSNKLLGKRDREKLSDLICNTAMDVMQAGGDDDVVKAIYDRHSLAFFKLGDLGADQAELTAMFSAGLGIELDENTDFSSPHAIMDAIRAKMEEEARAHEAAQEARRTRPNAREARRQAEEVKLQQSVRDIFRKLASALHPDRETDPVERTRKNALMQRVNVAYAANDLLGLLELQLEVEQIDQAGLNDMGDERIRQFNRVLERQVEDMRNDIDGLTVALAVDMGLPFDPFYTPGTLKRALHIEIDNMRQDVASIEQDLARFADVRVIKAWLKTYRIGDSAPDFDTPW